MERRERENRHHPAARVRAGERVCEQQWACEVRQHVDVQPRERALHYVVGQRRAQQREPRLRERPPESGKVAPVLRRQRPLAFLAPRPARLPRCLRRSRSPLCPARGLRARPLTRAGAPGAPACGRAGGASVGIFHTRRETSTSNENAADMDARGGGRTPWVQGGGTAAQRDPPCRPRAPAISAAAQRAWLARCHRAGGRAEENRA